MLHAWDTFSPLILATALMVMLAGIPLQVRTPRTFIPVNFTGLLLLFLGLTPLLSAFFGDMHGQWALGVGAALAISLTLLAFVGASGALMQSYERALGCSGSDVQPLEVPPLEVAVDKYVYVRWRYVPRVRSMDQGARAATSPVQSSDAARMRFSVTSIVADIALIIVVLPSPMVVIWSPLLPMIAVVLVLAALLGVAVAQRRFVFGATLGAVEGRQLLHVVDELSPRLLPLPPTLTPIWRYRDGARWWIAYTDPALGRRTLIMKAPRGGGADTIPRIRRKEWRAVLLIGLRPRMHGKGQAAHRTD